MAMFPKIQSPCPYKGDLSAVMDGDFCRMCKRNVIDLTAWTDAERVSFLASCQEEVCVSYRLPMRGAMVAAAMAAAVAALPAAAQDTATPEQEAAAIAAGDYAYEGDMSIMVGGIKDTRAVEFIDTTADATVPEMPVIYEDPKPADPVSGS